MFRRRDQLIEEAVAVLDQHFLQHGQNIKATLAAIGPSERDFIAAESERCATDERYYLENYHVIQSSEEGFKTLYPFWDSQEIFLGEFSRLKKSGLAIKLLCLKARQLGCSTISEALIFHKTIFNEACNTMVVAQDPSQADYLFSMCRRAYDSLPWWLRPEKRYEAKGRYLTLDRNDPQERLVNPGLRSEIFVEAANKMTGVAVGKRIRALHASELSSWATAEVLAEQIFPTIHGQDVIAIMESTARGRDNFFYKLWKDVQAGELDWTPIFIEAFRVVTYSIPIPKEAKFERTPEEESIKRKALEEGNCEVPDEYFNWRRVKAKEFEALGNEWGLAQEYPNSWVEAFQASGLCAFNKRKLQKLVATCIPPRWYGEIQLDDDALRKSDAKVPKVTLHSVPPGEKAPRAELYGSRLNVWELPQENTMYYVGADVAYGIKGGDYSVVQVIKIGAYMCPDVQVAEWHGWINPGPYASVIAALGFWYNTAQIAVEANDVGQLTNNELFRTLQYPNCFRWKHYDKIKNFMTDWFGWSTTVKTKPLIVSKMANAIDSDSVVIRSEHLIDEMFDFSQEGKKYTGLTGNDDRVMAFMITYFCAHDSEWGERAAEENQPDTEEDIKRRKMRDFANTDFAPSHDRPKYKKDVETAAPGDMLLYTSGQALSETDPDDAWRNF